jgi:uncharacterized integral membrane protein
MNSVKKNRSQVSLDPDHEEDGGKGVAGRANARLVVMMAAAALLVWFALANFGDVSINFWLHTSRAPLILVIVISGVLGAAISALARRHRNPRP